ncbi:MAG: hydrogenase expression/formation protein HypE [Candidatus Thorarchaeota archaeon]|nr:hydrogenase expression/formation protein HypE [Candidatus Thorarchaeota archaeon]
MSRIEPAHGAGGKVMQQLIQRTVIPAFTKRILGTVGLDEMDDGATLPLEGANLIVCADAHTVQPLFFPGGDIGKLAACGTVNDLTMMGAKPIAMTNTVVVEEGFEIEVLSKVLRSLDSVIEPLNVAMIAGDTKVMPRGTLDGLVLSTMGIGILYCKSVVADSGVRPGDDIIVTGPIGDHGVTLLAHLEGLSFQTGLVSDVAPLWNPIRDCLDTGGVHAMKDPTRGGTSVALNEFASKSKVEIVLEESLVPVRSEVKSLCDILGLNPMNMSCEGTALLSVDPEMSEAVLEVLRRHKTTEQARVIGKAVSGPPRVLMNTGVGGRKVVQVPYGEPVPRVC